MIPSRSPIGAFALFLASDAPVVDHISGIDPICWIGFGITTNLLRRLSVTYFWSLVSRWSCIQVSFQGIDLLMRLSLSIKKLIKGNSDLA